MVTNLAYISQSLFPYLLHYGQQCADELAWLSCPHIEANMTRFWLTVLRCVDDRTGVYVCISIMYVYLQRKNTVQTQ